jgi:RNA polymerase sigma factor (sigma-70 family)
MDGGQDASIQCFMTDFDLHYDKLKRHLGIEVRKLFKAWNRPLDSAQLEDEVQELLLRIHQASRGYDPARRSFRAWAHKVAMYRLIDREREFFREKKRPSVINRASLADERTFDLLLECRSVCVRSESPDEDIEAALREVEKLPDRERLAIRRKFLEDAEYASIAEELGISVARARHVVSDGVRRLTNRLRNSLSPVTH